MATQLQLRRGTTVENAGFTGALAEVTVDTDTHELRVHDGSTQGGFVIPTQAGVSSDLSGKADKSTTYTKTETDSLLGYKADTDMDNLTSTGANIANWSSNVSNCITEIPQDITLVLDNGLYVKSGSKVYYPDGTYKVLSGNSSTVSSGWGNQNEKQFAFCKANGDLWGIFPAAYCQSGATFDTSKMRPDGFGFWLDTINNIIKWTEDSGSTFSSGFSFPVGIVEETTNSGTIDKIDQVFNGFGYIGSTTYVLPGVKFLAPDGRNADGTLKSVERTISSLAIMTTAYNAPLILNYNLTLGVPYFTNYAVDTKFPTYYTNCTWYNPETNEMWHVANGVATTRTYAAICGSSTASSSRVTSLTINQPARLVDYSNTDYIAHQALPSTKYIDVSLGVSGSNYTAPADGYYTVNKGGSAGEWIYLLNTTSGLNMSNLYPGSLNARLFLPVAKGDTVQVQYTASGGTNWFRFVYANGAK